MEVSVFFRHHIILLLCFFLSVGSRFQLQAQQAYPYNVDTRPPRGFMPSADQLTSPADSIDPVNGKLHVQIPLASLPRGRAGSGFDVDLVYDSHVYDIVPHPITPLFNNPGPVIVQELQAADSTGNWKYNFSNFRLEMEERLDIDRNCPTNGPLRVYRYRIGLPDGSLHILHLKGFSKELSDSYDGSGFYGIGANGLPPQNLSGPLTCWTSAGWLYSGRLTYFTTDGSYLKLEIDADGGNWANKTWTLYFPDGRRALGKGSQIQALLDANGNQVTFENGCYDSSCLRPYTQIFHEQDRNNPNRKIVISYNITGADVNGSGVTQKTDTVTVTGPQGPVTWTINWQRITIGNDGRNYVWTDAYGQELRPLAWSHWVISSIQLPAPETNTAPISYQFTYSDNSTKGFGELRSMMTPSNALYEYAYRFDGSTCYTASSCQARSVDVSQYNWIVQRKISAAGITSLTWTYEYDHISNFKGTVHNPAGGTVVYRFGWGSWGPELVYRIDEPGGTTRKRVWAQNKPYPLALNSNYTPINPYIQKETVTAGDSAGNPAKTAVTENVIDKNGNRLQTTEYDWVNYSPDSVENGTTAKRVTRFTYFVAAPPAGDQTNDARGYWFPHQAPLSAADQRRLNAVKRSEISSDGLNTYAVTEFDYDDFRKAGNVTVERRWKSDSVPASSVPGLSASNAQVLQRAYDPYGNLQDIFPPEIRTHITYDAAGDFPMLVEYAYGQPEKRSLSYSWNTDAGVVNSKGDADNGIAVSYSYDRIGRVKTMNEAGLRLTQTLYDDGNRTVTSKRDLAGFQDGKLQNITRYDELGRVVATQTSDGPALNSAADGIKVSTAYGLSPSLGSMVVTSTPYRTLSDTTLEWNCTQYDQLGRVIVSAMFKGAAPPPSCSSAANQIGQTRIVYDADTVTITDAASKMRRESRDSLGRLTRVVEDPNSLNYATAYAYDPLDNLLGVTQGSQTRAFSYNSLGWLRSAAQPESGGRAIIYSYTDGGDLESRADPRGIVSSFMYDGLRRVKSKNYSDNTPAVTYMYYLAGSSSSPNIGQPRSVTSSAASTIYSGYNALGQMTASAQTIAGFGPSLSFSYSWWLNDVPKTLIYPSGRILNYSVDDAGRPAKIYTAARIYADMTLASNAYAADGRLSRMKFGNGLWETRDYHPAGSTPTVFQLGTSPSAGDRLQLEYYYADGTDNGNLVNHVIRQPGRVWTQTFTYDGVNRLTTANEQAVSGAPNGWTQIYAYDQWGNRRLASWSGLATSDTHEPAFSSNFDSATNRLNVAGSQFDSAGNQTFYAPFNLTYDAENRNTSASTSSLGIATFVYDGEGRRVKKIWTPSSGPSSTTYYVHDAFGQLAAEYSDQASSSGTSYVFTDLLGSVRAVTDSAGSVIECNDYLPFGRLLTSSDNGRTTGCYPSSATQTSNVLSEKFTGQKRDSETGIDFFGARYLSAAQARFTSPDRPLLDQNPSDPQSWNLYSYVRNNPLRFVDPTGQDCVYTDDLDSNGTVSVERGNCSRKTGTFVNGTLDTASLTFDSNRRTLGYTYSGSEGTIGTGVIGVSRPGDELDSKGRAFIEGMAARADASNEAVVGFAGLSVAGGAALAAPAIGGVIAQGVASTVGWGYGLAGGSGVVIGLFDEYPSYIEAAEATGANLFNLSKPLWSALSYFGETWTANRAFIDASIWRGQQFFLNTAPLGVEGTTYARELQYLTSRGVGPAQWLMLQRPF